MRGNRAILGVALVYAVLWFVGLRAAAAQDFPFVVPQAPEFDSRGQRGAAGRADNRAYGHQEAGVPIAAPKPGLRPERPMMQTRQAPVPTAPTPVQPRPQTTRTAPQPQRPAPSQPIAARSGPPAFEEQPARPDCSRFPSAIAQAASEAEMQNAARLYLTCLMQNGWRQDQAKNHVISVVESAYRATR